MSKKNLLNESQVRQFMKLAKLEPLAAGFVNGLTKKGTSRVNEAAASQQEELDELRTGVKGGLGPPDGTANPGHGRGKGVAASGATFEALDPDELEGEIGHDLGDDSLEGDEEALGDEEEIEGELDAEPDLDAGGEMTISVSDLLAALERAIEEVTGEEVETSMSDDLEGDEVEADLEADVELDAELDAGPEGLEAEDELELQEGGDKKGDEPADDLDYEKKNESAEATDDLVEQITKRVAARILKSALAKK